MALFTGGIAFAASIGSNQAFRRFQGEASGSFPGYREELRHCCVGKLISYSYSYDNRNFAENRLYRNPRTSISHRNRSERRGQPSTVLRQKIFGRGMKDKLLVSIRRSRKCSPLRSGRIWRSQKSGVKVIRQRRRVPVLFSNSYSRTSP